jgi:AcrR family transcriptional regulator
MTQTVFKQLRIQEKENRRLAIIDVAEDILNTEGLEAVTIRRVAKEAGLSSGAMYMYFKNKEELLLCMLIQNLKILKKDMAECLDNNDPVEAIKKMGYHYKTYFSRFGKHINILSFAVKGGRDFAILNEQMIDELDAALNDLLSIVEKLLSTPSMEGTLKGIPPERAVPVLWALIQGLVQITLTTPRTEAPTFDFDQLMNDATHILAPRSN